MTEKRFIYNKFDFVGNFEENELKLYEIDNNPSNDLDDSNLFYVYSDSDANIEHIVDKLNTLTDENEQLKKGMIEVVDRYIKNVECNPPSSARTYIKIKGALVNIREDLRDLRGDFE